MRSRRLAGTWWRGWLAVGHFGVDLLLAAFYLVLFALVVTGAVLVPVALSGIPLLWLGLMLTDGAAALERRRIEGATGVRVEAPVHRRRTRWYSGLLDPDRWRAVLYLLVQPLWGVVAGCLLLGLLSWALAAAGLPFYGRSVQTFPGTLLPGRPGLVLACLIGVALLVVVPLLAALLIRVSLALAGALLGPSRSAVEDALNARVHDLASSRHAVVDSVEAERQRIERDLHDGPQQRLVALSMGVGLARRRLEHDPAGAAELLDEVQATTRQAMAEMRQVARGIHPPVLTDRGLDAALSALAASSPVPTRVRVDLPVRPSPTLAAIAYFCVSEALTNAAKHAQATQVQVEVHTVDADLCVQVTDDGVGGAGTDTAGTGLRGLADRARAVDGALHLSSPPGGPTTVTVRLPLTPARETNR